MKVKTKAGVRSVGGGGVWGMGEGGLVDVNQESKVLLKDLKGIVQY